MQRKELNQVEKKIATGFGLSSFFSAISVITIINLFFMSLSCTHCFKDPKAFVEFYFFGALIGFSIYFSAAFMNNWLSRKVDWFNRPWLALGKVVVANVILTFVILLIINTLIFGIMRGQSISDSLGNFEFGSFLITLLVTLFITSLFQGAAFLAIWKEGVIKTERLKQATLNAQFETLNSQVNPHFLFNSLNVLSALVRKDPDQADQFIQELSNVYRNLLDTRKEEVITLKRELDALNSYTNLLQMRFGERLEIKMELEPSEDVFIVPFALQMLIENAIKHNVASKAQPLQIRVYKTDEKICVENNKQIKIDGVESRGIGLNNISDRYKMLAQDDIIVKDMSDKYLVQLAVIQN